MMFVIVNDVHTTSSEAAASEKRLEDWTEQTIKTSAVRCPLAPHASSSSQKGLRFNFKVFNLSDKYVKTKRYVLVITSGLGEVAP